VLGAGAAPEALSQGCLHAVGTGLPSSAFEVCFDAYEYWPRLEVLVLAASCHPPSLRDLHQRLRAEFQRLGIAADSTYLRPRVSA
jgi:hypothetical protein